MPALIFGLLAASVLVILGGAIGTAVVPPRLRRRTAVIWTLALLALAIALSATWAQLPHND